MRLIITVILLLTIGSKANSQNQMTLITSKERVRINLTGSGNAEICWGDGQKSKYRRLPSKYKGAFQIVVTNNLIAPSIFLLI